MFYDHINKRNPFYIPENAVEIESIFISMMDFLFSNTITLYLFTVYYDILYEKI